MDTRQFKFWCKHIVCYRGQCKFRGAVGADWDDLMKVCPLIKELEKRLKK